MLKLPIDQDQILKQLATESIRKGEDIRTTVRDLTLKALHGRQMTLAQIRDTLRTVTEGVNLDLLRAVAVDAVAAAVRAAVSRSL